MADELRRALALEHRPQVHACLDASSERGIGCLLDGLRERRMTDQPAGDQIPQIDGKVEEGWEVPDELGQQILRVVEGPLGQGLLAVGQMVNVCLDVAPQLRAAIAWSETQGLGLAAVDSEASKMSFGNVDELIAVQNELGGQAQQGGAPADI